MSSLSKLPPEVARELRRHVSAKPLKPTTSQSGARVAVEGAAQQLRYQQQGNGSKMVLAGCLAFTGVAFSVPFLAQQWIGNLNARDGPLTGAQVQRGAFLNSGSKDAGKDPQWDFMKGQYKKDDNYWAIFDNKAAQQAFGNIVSTSGKPNDQKSSSRSPNNSKD